MGLRGEAAAVAGHQGDGDLQGVGGDPVQVGHGGVDEDLGQGGHACGRGPWGGWPQGCG